MNHSLFLIVKVILLIILILVSFSCEEDETQPDETPKPGKRDYTWTVDTLAYPGSFQTLMQDIWASSPTDVYVVGHNDQNRGQMYHFNGVQWSPVKLLVIEGGGVTTGPIDLGAIYGFAANDIYAVGERIYQNPSPPPNFLDSSLIIHFDGRQWKEEVSQRGLL
ncbi:MAG: hypothetical protein HY960_15395, partial [Ignavibacteriae bacterium]|nr:hypothetical protein [Ignavibacteriota bacterium]